MFTRYTEGARQVLFYARYEASLLGAPVLETEHLWLGLLRQNKKLVKRLAPQWTVERTQQRLLQRGHNRERVSMTVGIPLSEELRHALETADAEATRRRQIYITEELLLLALLGLIGDPAP